MTLTGCKFSNLIAAANGGAIYVEAAADRSADHTTLIMANTTIEGCSALSKGGGIMVIGAIVRIKVRDTNTTIVTLTLIPLQGALHYCQQSGSP